MDDLILTPFSDKEMENEYTTHTFIEREIEFTILRLSNQVKPQSGNLYKFGVISLSPSFNYYWFFNNKAIVKGRLKALETFIALKKYCKDKKIGEPFAYKVSK